ncbi:hypothetical protein AB0N07_45705 [Streptomyces sp. NPDC051172]|uniref:hypothetical protein n=1 Tax=Streptomyces sp. NPDC051172 TaxID=3155796 RepID=UPI0034134BE1
MRSASAPARSAPQASTNTPASAAPCSAQRARLAEIRDNLLARILEAEREGWLGEMEGLEISLAGAQDKLAQLDAEKTRQRTIDLGMPTFSNLVGRTGSSPQPGFSAR